VSGNRDSSAREQNQPEEERAEELESGFHTHHHWV
jgi:hypothetical protein